MTVLVANLSMLGALCVLAAWWKGPERLALPALLLWCVGAVGIGLVRQIIVPGDLAGLPALGGLEPEVVRLVSWAAFASAASVAGWRESSRWAPLAFGAFFGELGGAILAVQGVDEPSARARRVLASTAGAMLGRVGDPAIWLSAGEGMTPLFFALVVVTAVVGVVLAAPPSVEQGETHRPLPVLAIGVAVWGAAWVPVLQLPAVAVGSVALWWTHRGQLHLQPVARVIGLSVTVLVSVVAGLGEAWADLLESRLVELEAMVPFWVWLHGAASGLLLGSDGGGLVGAAVLDRALAVRDPVAPMAWGLGAAVAGIAPYLLTGTLWRALPRHALWLLLSGALVLGAAELGLLAP